MKKSISLLFIFVCICTFSFAQKSAAKPLSADSPLNGLWEFEVNEDGDMDYNDGAPIFGPGMGQKIIGIASGEGSCMLAAFSDPEMGFACPTYFTFLTDGQTVYGTCTNTCMVEKEGDDFTFEYAFDEASETLYIIVEDVKYPFKPYNFD